MTATVRYHPERPNGFRLEQLAAAFDRVRDPRDWQAPIRAVISTGERQVVETAVIWFTETLPSFEAAPGEVHRLVVTAQGYRHGTGGSL